MQGFDLSSIINTEELSVFVEYNDQVSVEINHIPREKMSEIIRQATKTTWKDHQPIQTLDQLKLGELIGLAAINSWTGLVVGDQPLACSPENKKLVMRKWGNFAKFVADTCTDLDRLIDVQRENLQKNSETTSGRG